MHASDDLVTGGVDKQKSQQSNYIELILFIASFSSRSFIPLVIFGWCDLFNYNITRLIPPICAFNLHELSFKVYTNISMQ